MTDGKDEGVNIIKVAFDNAEPDKPSLRETVAALAEMEPLDYLEIKKDKARELEISATDLDRAVRDMRAKDGGTKGQGRPVNIASPEPWGKSPIFSLISSLMPQVKNCRACPASSNTASAAYRD